MVTKASIDKHQHVASKGCWCNPVEDEVEGVWIHNMTVLEAIDRAINSIEPKFNELLQYDILSEYEVGKKHAYDTMLNELYTIKDEITKSW